MAIRGKGSPAYKFRTKLGKMLALPALASVLKKHHETMGSFGPELSQGRISGLGAEYDETVGLRTLVLHLTGRIGKARSVDKEAYLGVLAALDDTTRQLFENDSFMAATNDLFSSFPDPPRELLASLSWRMLSSFDTSGKLAEVDPVAYAELGIRFAELTAYTRLGNEALDLQTAGALCAVAAKGVTHPATSPRKETKPPEEDKSSREGLIKEDQQSLILLTQKLLEIGVRGLRLERILEKVTDPKAVFTKLEQLVEEHGGDAVLMMLYREKICSSSVISDQIRDVVLDNISSFKEYGTLLKNRATFAKRLANGFDIPERAANVVVIRTSRTRLGILRNTLVIAEETLQKEGVRDLLLSKPSKLSRYRQQLHATVKDGLTAEELTKYIMDIDTALPANFVLAVIGSGIKDKSFDPTDLNEIHRHVRQAMYGILSENTERGTPHEFAIQCIQKGVSYEATLIQLWKVKHPTENKETRASQTEPKAFVETKPEENCEPGNAKTEPAEAPRAEPTKKEEPRDSEEPTESPVSDSGGRTTGAAEDEEKPSKEGSDEQDGAEGQENVRARKWGNKLAGSMRPYPNLEKIGQRLLDMGLLNGTVIGILEAAIDSSNVGDAVATLELAMEMLCPDCDKRTKKEVMQAFFSPEIIEQLRNAQIGDVETAIIQAEEDRKERESFSIPWFSGDVSPEVMKILKDIKPEDFAISEFERYGILSHEFVYVALYLLKGLRNGSLGNTRGNITRAIKRQITEPDKRDFVRAKLAVMLVPSRQKKGSSKKQGRVLKLKQPSDLHGSTIREILDFVLVAHSTVQASASSSS